MDIAGRPESFSVLKWLRCIASMVVPSDGCDCDGAVWESCRPDIPALFACCICEGCELIWWLSKVESYRPLTSCAGRLSSDVRSAISDALACPE